MQRRLGRLQREGAGGPGPEGSVPRAGRGRRHRRRAHGAAGRRRGCGRDAGRPTPRRRQARLHDVDVEQV